MHFLNFTDLLAFLPSEILYPQGSGFDSVGWNRIPSLRASKESRSSPHIL